MGKSPPEYRPVIKPLSEAGWSPEEVAGEKAMHEAGQRLLNIEQMTQRVDAWRQVIPEGSAERQTPAALRRCSRAISCGIMRALA
jgi:hypothetical protein